MWNWPPHGLPDLADGIGDPSDGTKLQAWVGGIILALIPVAYGGYCLLRGATVLPGRGRWVTVVGWSGTMFAVALIALGCLAHFHYFWPAHDRLRPYCLLGKQLALAVFAIAVLCGSVGFLAWG